MNAEQYNRWSAPLRENPALGRVVIGAGRALTYACYVAFPLLVAFELLIGAPLWLRTVLTCGISFCLVSVVRSRLDASRPYEALDIEPLIVKDTHGRSHPSRHTFSIFAIAMAFLAWNTAAGIVLLVAGCYMAVVRVLGGVHYPRDVAAGAVLGIAAGLIGFWLVP